MSGFARGAGESGALFTWQKTMPNNASWLEDLQVIEGSTPMDWTRLTVRITLRDCKNGSPVLTLESGDRSRRAESRATARHCRSLCRRPISLASAAITSVTSPIAIKTTTCFLLAHGIVSVRDNPRHSHEQHFLTEPICGDDALFVVLGFASCDDGDHARFHRRNG